MKQGTRLLAITYQKLIQYIKTRGAPDDSFHAATYCLLASMFDVRRPDIMAPIRENSDEAALNFAEEQVREEIESMAPAYTEPDNDFRGY